MEELFKDVIGFEDYFKISNLGSIFSKRSNRLLKVSLPKGKGYASFTTQIGGRTGTNHTFRIHRLVAEAFIENPLNKPEVNHIDGNKFNNCVSNLEWVTHDENIAHAKSNNLFKPAHGTLNYRAKLSAEDVLFIRDSSQTIKALAEHFKVCRNTISKVKNGKSYKTE